MAIGFRSPFNNLHLDLNPIQSDLVFARPAGKRCFVVSSKGTTVSRLRYGAVLHHFPSALPSGSRKKTVLDPSQSYSILDYIFYELDQTYYVIEMACWRGYSLHDCSAEFIFFWMNSKLAETGACDPLSTYHKYRFSQVPMYNCDESGLQMAYSGVVPSGGSRGGAGGAAALTSPPAAGVMSWWWRREMRERALSGTESEVLQNW